MRINFKQSEKRKFSYIKIKTVVVPYIRKGNKAQMFKLN